jgi:GT2 family glycosyltransferase
LNLAKSNAPGDDDVSGSWPKLTVVTPSFNQAAYLEEAICSVLQQGYPNLEYIIIDGGSQDGSKQILQTYAPLVSFWCSEKDRGQAHAINKGLSRATGEFFNWINSDDRLAPGALFEVARRLGDADLVAGGCLNFDEQGHQCPIVNSGLTLKGLLRGSQTSVFHQPGLWWRRDWLQKCHGLDEGFDLAFDYDLLLRYLALGPRVVYTPQVLAHFRLHPASKTCSRVPDYAPERERILVRLAATAASRPLRRGCRRRVRQLQWWREVQQASERASAGRWRAVAKLALGTAADPFVRVNRFTLGAIRKALSRELSA